MASNGTEKSMTCPRMGEGKHLIPDDAITGTARGGVRIDQFRGRVAVAPP